MDERPKKILMLFILVDTQEKVFTVTKSTCIITEKRILIFGSHNPQLAFLSKTALESMQSLF